MYLRYNVKKEAETKKMPPTAHRTGTRREVGIGSDENVTEGSPTFRSSWLRASSVNLCLICSAVASSAAMVIVMRIPLSERRRLQARQEVQTQMVCVRVYVCARSLQIMTC